MKNSQNAIRPASPADINAMREIERAAGQLFADIGMDEVAAHEPATPIVLAHYIQSGRAWLAGVGGMPVGYALADVVDGCGHLEQVSVRPEYGRRGLGRVLIDAVIDWAVDARFPALTLITFRDVPWDGPYYASLGFRPLLDTHLGPGFRTLRDHETKLGLDRDARQSMRLDLTAARR